MFEYHSGLLISVGFVVTDRVERGWSLRWSVEIVWSVVRDVGCGVV